MSTIEKAAARIASRQKNKVSNVPSGALSSNGVVGVAPESSRRGPAIGPRRFCEIDLDAIRERGFLTPDEGRSQLAQEMRRIKRPLLLNVQKAHKTEQGGIPNLVMVTSALPAEGKTFISINLAMSIAAEVNRRVLLVDADIARGDVCRQLGVEPGRGLSDLLQETSYLSEDGVLGTNVDGLSILPSGNPTDHVDELFSSDVMVDTLRSLAEEDPDRLVVFDASPLLATTEAAVLAHHMGQVVVVVEASRTPRDAVRQALQQLDGCGNVQLVLNKAAGNAAGYGYGYGYGYGEVPARHEEGEAL